MHSLRMPAVKSFVSDGSPFDQRERYLGHGSVSAGGLDQVAVPVPIAPAVRVYVG
jgi:hypothetical protein